MAQQTIPRGINANAPASDRAPTARWLGLAGCDALTAAAMCLTVAGWALIWARALSIIEFVPVPLAVIAFFSGLILIPFRSASRSSRNLSGTEALNLALFLIAGCVFGSSAAKAQNCPIGHDQLTQALKAAVKPSGGPSNGGLDNNEWAAVVTRDGTICAVTFSGQKPTDQWPASRIIAVEKAVTANGVSVDKMALSTANLYGAALPGGSLYGLITTTPAIAGDLYAGDPNSYGGPSDPLIGKHVGGGVVFGGGLALYNEQGVVGALGVSGDTSCADHNVAWRIRHEVKLDHAPGGVSPDHNDAMIYDMLPDKTSASGYGHPQCGGREAEVAEQIHSGFVPKWAQVMQK